jgi:hypothetical protein
MFAYASWMAKHGGYANGMTIRDYFAAKAMLAIMGSDRYTGVVGVNNYVQSVSRDAYKMADAMLEARK